MKRRIGILTCLWKRAALERIVMEWYGSLDVEGVDLVLLAVGSEGEESRTRAEESGWHYIAARNNPLSNKHNKGMRWFQDKNVDGVIVIGSDDLMTAGTIEALVNEGRTGGVVGQEDLYYYDQRYDRLHYGTRLHPGAGTLYGTDTLDKVGWEPWPKDHEDKLDGKAANRIHRLAYGTRFRTIAKGRENGLFLVDIKSDLNMWGLAHVRTTTNRVELADLAEFDAAFPGIRDKLCTIKTA